MIHKDYSPICRKRETSKENMIPGIPNYRERVDFGEFIGYYVTENQPNLKNPYY